MAPSSIHGANQISSLPYWCVADLCQEAEDAELITPLEADAALDLSFTERRSSES
jgi:hypothetical protein